MDELDEIIKRMIEAGEPEEAIAAVIQSYQDEQKANSPITEPTSWGEGVLNSITSGEAARYGGEGLKGFLQGAVLDLPGNVMSGLGSIVNMAKSPQDASEELGKLWESAKALPGDMWNAAKQSGSSLEAAGDFGRSMGQVTGQPLLTAGAVKYGPSTARTMAPPVGRGLETVGNFVAEHGAASGFLPPITTPHFLRLGERAAGRGLADIGRRMQRRPPLDSEVTSQYGIRNEGTRPDIQPESAAGPIVEGEIIGSNPFQLNPVGLPPKPPGRRITLKRKSVNTRLADKLREQGFKFENADGENVTFRQELK